MTLVYSTIFNEDPAAAKALPLLLKLSPTEARRLIPARNGKYAMVGMACHGISTDRHLEGCRTDAEPQDYETVGQQLAKSAVVDPAFPLRTGTPVKFISIQFRVENSDAPAIKGPCWPPSCILEPAPPTPPQR